MTDEKIRCHWCTDSDLYTHYHDNEWGVPCFDDQKLFEILILEGAQAGLSWITILKRREGYRRAFDNFDVDKVASYQDDKLEDLMQNNEIIRNRLKINSVVKNAKAFIQIQKEFGSFSHYLWAYVDNKPIINHLSHSTEAPAFTKLSEKISRDLKKRGMNFVGPTIIYAYMQAVGLVNDHIDCCFKRQDS